MGGVIEFLRTLYEVGLTQYALGGVFEYCNLLVYKFTGSQVHRISLADFGDFADLISNHSKA